MVIKFRMIDGDVATEMDLQPPDELCRKCNFREQVQHLLSLAKIFCNQFDVEQCFSAAGNTVQQAYAFSRQTIPE